MRIGKWKRTMMCSNCRYLEDFTLDDVCPKCGDFKIWDGDDTYWYHYGWHNVTARKVDDSVWYKPATWGKYHYEVK